MPPRSLSPAAALPFGTARSRESTGSGIDQVAIEIDGGTVDLGTGAAAGNNTIDINGDGQFISNTSGDAVQALGNTWKQDGVAITSDASIEADITDGLDPSGSGVVVWATSLIDVSNTHITYGDGTATLSGTLTSTISGGSAFAATGSVSVTLGSETYLVSISAADGTFSQIFDTDSLGASSYAVGYSYDGDTYFAPRQRQQ